VKPDKNDERKNSTPFNKKCKREDNNKHHRNPGNHHQRLLEEPVF
jgi:hypothetical protein